MKTEKNNLLHMDSIFLLALISLVGFGMVIIYSSSGAFAESKNLPNTYYLVSHVKKVALGLCALALGMLVPYRFWYRMARPLLLISILLLVYLITASDVSGVHGAKRWIQIGGFGLQPSELAKIAAIFFLGRLLVEREKRMQQFRKGVLASLIAVGVLFALVLAQPDYSSAVILVAISAVMIFSGGAKLVHLVFLALLTLPAMGLLMISSSYRMQRVLAFLNPDENTASSYQAIQSLISLGNGGWAGTGLGTSTQKLGYLPMPFTDTIFSILGEEMGFVGTFLCLFLFGVFLWRGLGIAFYCADRFGSLVAMGAMSSIGVTVIMHVGVCSGIFPTTGQPLPFVSFGGTALISMLFIIGVLLNVSSYPPAESASQLATKKRQTYRGALAKQRLSV